MQARAGLTACYRCALPGRGRGERPGYHSREGQGDDAMERHVSNQDIQGKAPADEAPDAPAGTPAYFEQQLAKERDARALMRDRLRHTEALAAESHALRARMAQELERVTADRDRLRNAASTSTPTSAGSPAFEATRPAVAPSSRAEPPLTPRFADMPLRPPAMPKRSGPWGALVMLGVLAAVVGALAWYNVSVPGAPKPGSGGAATASRTNAPQDASTALASTAGTSATRTPPPTAASVLAANPAANPATTAPANPPDGAVALPPLTPEAQLAAAPTAAGPAPAPAPAAPATPVGMAARLRQALDGEGITSPVDVDAATGRVTVSDPQPDAALRSRTDMLVRAVYAGASLPEPQIEHRWMSPMRGSHAAPVATAAPPSPAQAASLSAAAAYAARHASRDSQDALHHHKGAGATTVADVESLRPVLPEGRVTASCRESLAGRTLHRSDMTACMKHSCCSSAASHNAEDCRAYEKAYPFTCGG